MQYTGTRAALLACSLIPGLVAGLAASQPVAGSDQTDGTEPGEQETGACTDPCLKAAITALYIRSPLLNPFRLGIAVNDSVATLEGSVSDAGERVLAGEIAAGVARITAVVNRIRVKPGTSAQHHASPQVDCLTGDAALADRVRTQLHWNRATHGMAVTASARDGIVSLRNGCQPPTGGTGQADCHQHLRRQAGEQRIPDNTGTIAAPCEERLPAARLHTGLPAALRYSNVHPHRPC